MSLIKSVSAAAAVAILASAANAAITPFWRNNPISPAGFINGVPAGAQSWSLMVELTAPSLFNVAGLQLLAVGGTTYYHHPAGTDTNVGNPILIPIFPALEWDTYVRTTDPNQAAAVPGKYVGPGAADFGQPPNSSLFNVAWGALPNTGPTPGIHEIARITFTGGIPQVNGEVRENTNPNAFVPIPQIPEPAALGLAALGLGLAALRRR